jgi:DNA-binding NarL/FixJ family response regulator
MAAPPARVTIRVAVQSARRLHRDTLSACLSVRPDITVVGKIAELGDLPELCQLARPDVAILDAGPRLREFAVLVGALIPRIPELNLIVTYRDASRQDLAAATRAGIAYLVPESHGLAAVLSLLRRGPGRHTRAGQGGLSERELELVGLTGSGHSVSEIAALLKLSPLTVENLKRRIYAKMGVHSGAHAVSRAVSLGMLDQWTAPAPRRQVPAAGEFPLLAVVSGPSCWARDQVVRVLAAGQLPFVLIREHGPAADAHWARWHRGPIVAALVDPGPPDWELARELGVPAILVHSKPFDPPELADALANGACALVPADKIEDHFRSVLTMVGQGYLVVDSAPMRLLLGAVRARWDYQVPGAGGIPQLTARESDILQAAGQGYSIRQTAQALGIAPKTVENIQTRLFRKLGVRNRSGALAVADALGLLAGPATAQAWPAAGPAAPWGDPSPALDDGPGSYWSGEDWRP